MCLCRTGTSYKNKYTETFSPEVRGSHTTTEGQSHAKKSQINCFSPCWNLVLMSGLVPAGVSCRYKVCKVLHRRQGWKKKRSDEHFCQPKQRSSGLSGPLLSPPALLASRIDLEFLFSHCWIHTSTTANVNFSLGQDIQTTKPLTSGSCSFLLNNSFAVSVYLQEKCLWAYAWRSYTKLSI